MPGKVVNTCGLAVPLGSDENELKWTLCVHVAPKFCYSVIFREANTLFLAILHIKCLPLFPLFWVWTHLGGW